MTTRLTEGARQGATSFPGFSPTRLEREPGNDREPPPQTLTADVLLARHGTRDEPLRKSAWEARSNSTFLQQNLYMLRVLPAQGKLVLQQMKSHPRVPRVPCLLLNLIQSLFKQLATT